LLVDVGCGYRRRTKRDLQRKNLPLGTPDRTGVGAEREIIVPDNLGEGIRIVTVGVEANLRPVDAEAEREVTGNADRWYRL
jgi:hypothetical protein